MAANKECAVCRAFKQPENFPTSPITQNCKHSPTTCLECIQATLRSELARQLWQAIECPECSAIFEYQDIQRYADKETRKKHDSLIARRAIQQDAAFLWCSFNCGSGQIHDGGYDQPIMKCSACDKLTCFQHKVAWHSGLTCEEYEEEIQARHKKENAASQRTIKRVTKHCPGCQANIQKNGGCAHMVCSKCSHQFCWECMADYKTILTTDNNAHNGKCPFHSKNLPEYTGSLE